MGGHGGWPAAVALAVILSGCAAPAVHDDTRAGRPPPAAEPAPEGPAGPSRSGAVAALADRADAAFRAGRFGEAAATLERALGIDARDAGAWLALGWVRLGQGDRQQARVLADRALRLGGPASLACRAERLARSDAVGRGAIEARERARRDCGPGRG